MADDKKPDDKKPEGDAKAAKKAGYTPKFQRGGGFPTQQPKGGIDTSNKVSRAGVMRRGGNRGS